VTRLRQTLRDPFAVSVIVLGVLAVTGLVGIGVGWRGAAAELDVAVQVPYIVSGAIGGLALLGFSLGLLLIQARRREEARRRADLQRVVRAAADVLAAVRARPR
jgi:hypothetical protein